MSLTTRAVAKIHLGIAASDTTEDSAIDQWITQVDALIKSYLKQNIEQATYTEFHCGNGTPKLVLRQRPVQSITSIHEDSAAYFGEASGAFASATQLTAGSDYALYRDQNNSATEKSKSGIVVRIGGVWPAVNQQIQGLLAQGVTEGVGNIKVVYVGGWASVPADIQLAANQMIAILRQGAQQGGPLQSESLDYYSYQLQSAGNDGASAIGSVKQLLSTYRKWVW